MPLSCPSRITLACVLRPSTTYSLSSSAPHLPCIAARRSCPYSLSSFSTFVRQLQQQKDDQPSAREIRNPRWLADQRERLGKCITFGLTEEQVKSAATISHMLANQWQGLLVGAEGFFISKKRQGQPWKEKVLWGEMVKRASTLRVKEIADKTHRIAWCVRSCFVDPTRLPSVRRSKSYEQ